MERFPPGVSTALGSWSLAKNQDDVDPLIATEDELTAVQVEKNYTIIKSEYAADCKYGNVTGEKTEDVDDIPANNRLDSLTQYDITRNIKKEDDISADYGDIKKLEMDDACFDLPNLKKDFEIKDDEKNENVGCTPVKNENDDGVPPMMQARHTLDPLENNFHVVVKSELELNCEYDHLAVQEPKDAGTNSMIAQGDSIMLKYDAWSGHDLTLDYEIKIEEAETQEQFTCRDCDVRSSSQVNLKVRERLHALKKPFACASCDYKLKSSALLKEHMRTHTGLKPFACEVCGRRSKTRSDLKKHEKIHTEEKPLACNYCDYRCRHAGHLRIHERIHTGEKPFACDSCDYKCRRKEHLKVHILNCHTSEKPFACDTCDYRSSMNSNLKAHKKTHTEAKPFTCGECGFRCNLAGNLKMHTMSHSGEKPFACNECVYSCYTRKDLKIHLRKHTGEKPFACESCDYRCAHNSSLKYHMKRSHRRKPIAKK